MSLAIYELADTSETLGLQAIRVNQFEESGRNLRDAIPYMQVNPTTYFHAVYQAISSILKKSGLQTTVHNAFRSLANHLLKRAEAMPPSLREDRVTERGALQTTGEKPLARTLLRVSEQLLTMITSLGLIRDELDSWPNSLRDLPDETALPELNEIELMQNELFWQIKKVRQVLGKFLDKDCDGGSSGGQALQAIAADIDTCLNARTVTVFLPLSI